MDTVRIEDFPSNTNFRNFEYDLNTYLPGVPWQRDDENEAIVMQLQYYEDNRERITEFAKQAGAVVFRPE